MKLSTILKLVSMLIWLALACAEETVPMRSVGSGDGDEGDGDGDGDGDEGDGDGDGDGDEPTLSLAMVEVPKPAGVFRAAAVALNNDGHVLIYADEEELYGDEVAYFLWRGDDEAPEELQPPDGYTFRSVPFDTQNFEHVWCLFDDGSYLVDLLGGPEEWAVARIADGAIVESHQPSEERVVGCNSVGQVVTDDSVLGSGEPIELPGEPSARNVLGINDEGAVAMTSEYWVDGESLPYPATFKAYHGPSGHGVVLGSYDEVSLDDTVAALWDPETNEVTLLPAFIEYRGVPGPALIGEGGDVVVTTTPRSTRGADYYLFRDGSYAPMGTSGVSVSNAIDVNAHGQVLSPVAGYPATDHDYAGVVFTPQN